MSNPKGRPFLFLILSNQEEFLYNYDKQYVETISYFGHLEKLQSRL